ncbi:MAG: family 43 glycosylhydrolase [Burkholderiales bacterium]|nr:family 43 glycosylhydrolase [Phycisphaerae bacterium]
MSTQFAAALCVIILLTAQVAPAQDAPAWDSPGNANPILPGYYADPSVVRHDGKYFMYATLDPWGDETLGCWESADFKNWTFRELNWPTKKLCTSPTSGGAKVWAPSVIKAPSGKFHMFVSVGSEVWTGVADSPTGPWKNTLGDKPLVRADFNAAYHMIDADAFIDDDGAVYLYWGSGWNWVNGHCFVAKMNHDLTGFDGEVKDVTPGNYFEGPIMLKQKGKYYLTYSQGRTDRDTYAVHYATGDSPLGPFTEASTSPILITDKPKNILGPGHHTFLREEGKTYIVYHRHSLPFQGRPIRRQICMDELHFDEAGLIKKIVPTLAGPSFAQGRGAGRVNIAAAAIATASDSDVPERGAMRVLDDNYATRWAPKPDAAGGWLQLDLGSVKKIAGQEIRPEYAWKPYAFKIESSNDAATWQTVVDYTDKPVRGSPLIIDTPLEARYLRIVFPASVPGRDISLWEWNCYAP